MVLQSKDLIQINATIITGLLILLTIQATAAGTVPFLVERSALYESIDAYDELINSTKNDPILLEHMKTRQAELKIQTFEVDLRLGQSSDNYIINLFYNPITTFSASMFFFVVSCIAEIPHSSKHEAPSKLGRSLTIVGFMTMGFTISMLIIIPAL